MSINTENLKIKIEIGLRSSSQFFILSFAYIVLRGLFSNPDTSEFLEHSKYGEFLTKLFFTLAGIVIPTTLFYTMTFGIRYRANLKIVIPALVLVIVLLEVFVYK